MRPAPAGHQPTGFAAVRSAPLLTDAREGRDVIRSKIDIEIEEKINPSNNASQADIFNKLKARKDQIPIRPLTEGTL